MKYYSKILLLLIILLNGLLLRGQSLDLILTIQQNDKWFDTLNALTVDEKLDIIKTRMLKDTIVYNSNQSFHRMYSENYEKDKKLKELGNIANGRILYFVFSKSRLLSKGKYIEFEFHNWTKVSEVKLVHDFLTLDKVSDIKELRDDKEEEAIYATAAGFGVISFELKKRKYCKQFESLLNE